jgi:hypothetical protein
VLDDRQHEQLRAEHGGGLEEVARQQRVGLRAQELRPGAGCPLRCGVEAGLLEDLPHGRRPDLDTEDQQFTVHPPVPPGGVLGDQPGSLLAARWRVGSVEDPCRNAAPGSMLEPLVVGPGKGAYVGVPTKMTRLVVVRTERSCWSRRGKVRWWERVAGRSLEE